MTTLAHDIEALRLKMIETAEEEGRLVGTLAQRLHEADDRVLHMLQQIVVDQRRRRADIAELLGIIAARLGHLPRDVAGMPSAQAPAEHRRVAYPPPPLPSPEDESAHDVWARLEAQDHHADLLARQGA